MLERGDAKKVAALSFYGLSMVWSPIFGTSEAVVFPGLSQHTVELTASRITALVSLAVAMLIFSAFGKWLRGPERRRMLVCGAACVGVVGMVSGCAPALSAAPLWALYIGALCRGLYSGVATVAWIEVLIRVEKRCVGPAIAASLVLYSAAGLLIMSAACVSPALASALLAACPIATCAACMRVSRSFPRDHPVDQGGEPVGALTCAKLCAANFAFGLMLGAVLCYFAMNDTAFGVASFLAVSLALLAVFSLVDVGADMQWMLRLLMIGFSCVVTLAVLLGVSSREASVCIASAMLAAILLYTCAIFIDTQARFRNPFWRIPGATQFFAALGMAASTALLCFAVPLDADPDRSVMLVCAACLVFIAAVFFPSERSVTRPWGFASLVPPESVEVRRLRRCGELAGDFSLTTRELEVLQQMSSGASKDDIAAALVISPATAKTHIRNIYAKVGVHSHEELMRLVDE